MLRLALCLTALAFVTACGHHGGGGGGGARGPDRIGDANPVDFGTKSPDRHPVHGIDVSKFQGEIDWDRVQDAGIGFAFLKATEGGDRVDPSFDANWQEARRAGVARGAYHFYYLCGPATEQARWFIAHVPRSPGALPPVLDMEWTPFSPTCTIRPDGAHIRSEAKIFLDLLEAHYGQAPILYSSVEFWNDNQMWLIPGQHEYWLRSTAAHPSEIFSGQPWTFWQYTGTGLVPGIAGQTDINVFQGSTGQWQDWLARRGI